MCNMFILQECAIEFCIVKLKRVASETLFGSLSLFFTLLMFSLHSVVDIYLLYVTVFNKLSIDLCFSQFFNKSV